MEVDLFDYINQHWGGIVAIAVLLVAVVVSFKVIISLDVNKLIDQRKRSHLHKAQVACPHFYFTGNIERLSDKSGAVEYQSFLKSPSGTVLWQCAKCGAILPDDNTAETKRLSDYYVNHIKAYSKAMKKVDKHLKKSL